MWNDYEHLCDAREALDWIETAIGGRTEAEFVGDEVLRSAVAQRLAAIGEAAALLSPEITARYPSVSWDAIMGLQSLLVDESSANWPLVWQTAAEHAPVLRDLIGEILAAEISGQ